MIRLGRDSRLPAKADNGRRQYLVKWTGYKEPTWQPASDLKGCDEIFRAFHDANLKKGKPPSLAQEEAKEYIKEHMNRS